MSFSGRNVSLSGNASGVASIPAQQQEIDGTIIQVPAQSVTMSVSMRGAGQADAAYPDAHSAGGELTVSANVGGALQGSHGQQVPWTAVLVTVP